jgi:large subunit ribosomal protein L11
MSFVRFVKLRVPAGSARPGPAIGQSLGPLGINMAGELGQRRIQVLPFGLLYALLSPLFTTLSWPHYDYWFCNPCNPFQITYVLCCPTEFCKQFNERSEKVYKKDTPLSVELNAMSDRSFTFDIRSPPTSYLILKAAGLQKGASSPNSESPIGYITPEQVYEIARIKQRDEMRFHLPLESIARSVLGSAKTMGVAVREEQEEDEDENITAA